MSIEDLAVAWYRAVGYAKAEKASRREAFSETPDGCERIIHDEDGQKTCYEDTPDFRNYCGACVKRQSAHLSFRLAVNHQAACKRALNRAIKTKLEARGER